MIPVMIDSRQLILGGITMLFMQILWAIITLVLVIFTGAIIYFAYKLVKQLTQTNQYLGETIKSTNQAIKESQKTLKATNQVLKDVDTDNRKLQPAIKAIQKLGNDISDLSDGVRKSSARYHKKSLSFLNKIRKML